MDTVANNEFHTDYWTPPNSYRIMDTLANDESRIIDTEPTMDTAVKNITIILWKVITLQSPHLIANKGY